MLFDKTYRIRSGWVRSFVLSVTAAGLAFGPSAAQEKLQNAPKAETPKKEEKKEFPKAETPKKDEPKKEEKKAEPKPDYRKMAQPVVAAFKDAVNKPSQSVVRVYSDGKDAALGTVVGPDGWILTKSTLLQNKLTCKLRDGRTFDARIVGIHEQHDLALLKIDVAGLQPIEWVESKTAPVGNWIASPSNGDEPVAVGVVSVAARNVRVMRAAPAPQGGYLGVLLEPAGANVKLTDVTRDSPAAKAGLKVNDIILSVGGKPVTTPDSMIGILQKMKPGEEVTLKIKRDNKEQEVKVKLGKRPASRGDIQNNMGSTLSERRTGFPTFLQHDSVVKPTDCGGPIVDLDGKAIGINIARAGRTETHAIPTETLMPLMYDLMSGRLAPKDAAVVSTDLMEGAKAALKRAEEDIAAAAKRLSDARAALEKAEVEQKKLAEAKKDDKSATKK